MFKNSNIENFKFKPKPNLIEQLKKVLIKMYLIKKKNPKILVKQN